MSVSENQKIQLTVVVAAWNAPELLRENLASLARQTEKTGLEVVVAANYPVGFAETEFEIPVKILHLPETASVPELRSAGVSAAAGEIVAIAEDQCFFDERWCERIKKAHAAGHAVVGGAVENAATGSALDWAVYFYDYGKYMPPVAAGRTDALSGMNVSYKRAPLAEIRPLYEAGFYETFVNEELKRRGHELFLEPEAVVYHRKNYRIARAAAHCYHLARDFAARRVAGSAFSRKAFLTTAALALPVLLPARIFAATIKKGRNLNYLLKAAPLVVFLMLIWSYGEFCGYLLGAGDSRAKWR